MAHASMMERMKGAAMLRVDTFEEVEHDETATGQAAGVVALVAVAHAIGSWDAGLFSLVGSAVTAVVGWGIWAGATWLVGDKMFGGTATWGELLRTLGFASAPGLLAVVMILPFVDWIVATVVFFWTLAAGVVAIRQALDFGTGKALLTGFVGWIIVVVIQGVLRF